MAGDEIALHWSRKFGLALAPLFRPGAGGGSDHNVLLDGGRGTFALSVQQERVEPKTAAEWAWSSDIPHHLTVTEDEVSVVRWDEPARATRFARESVDRDLEGFYRFLIRDRIRSTTSVVEHLVHLFRQMRSLVHDAGHPDDSSVDAYLVALARLVSNDLDFLPLGGDWGLSGNAVEIESSLNQEAYRQTLIAAMEVAGPLGIRLMTELSIRHAASRIFQEAHFEFLRAPQVDLFGFAGEAEAAPRTRGVAHYTPPALARTLVEQAFHAFGDIEAAAELHICDPACGSGAILNESLRALERKHFGGKLIIRGRDISAVAVKMAIFAITASLRDWSPPGGCEIDIQVADSLEEEIPHSDIIVMNPPFLSWGMQSQRQREQSKNILGEAQSAKSDLSTVFAWKAFKSLREQGVLGTLFPASILSQKSAAKWRETMADSADISFVASIGEYGLFLNALVQVGCLVVANRANAPATRATALVTEDDPQATGDALRWLRKIDELPPPLPIKESRWAIFGVPKAEFSERDTWRFLTPAADELIKRLGNLFGLLGDVFDVRQGVQTGHNPAFVLTKEELAKLPRPEREFFRLATMTDSIEFGQLVKPYYVFFPHEDGRPLFESEEAMKQAVPSYHHKYLRPHEEKLKARKAIRDADRADWWGLMRHREWSSSQAPKIISKYFGQIGAFWLDEKGTALPLTGFAWVLKQSGNRGRSERLLSLQAYDALFNSDVFQRLLSVYCPRVSGGQFDLSYRYVRQVPLPPFTEALSDAYFSRSILSLAALGKAPNVADARWRAQVNSLAADLYGSEVLSSI